MRPPVEEASCKIHQGCHKAVADTFGCAHRDHECIPDFCPIPSEREDRTCPLVRATSLGSPPRRSSLLMMLQRQAQYPAMGARAGVSCLCSGLGGQSGRCSGSGCWMKTYTYEACHPSPSKISTRGTHPDPEWAIHRSQNRGAVRPAQVSRSVESCTGM